MDLHIGLIPDGNRRFARKHLLSLETIYSKSIDKAWEVAEWCCKYGAKSVTMYAFSTENFNRSEYEINLLYRLLSEMLDKILEDDSFHYKVLIRGNRELLAQKFNHTILDRIDKIEEKTASFDEFTVILLLGYGARDEVESGLIRDYPNVNILIRTAGEQRTSNFPFSPNAYFYSCRRMFPAIRFVDVKKAIKRGKILSFS